LTGSLTPLTLVGPSALNAKYPAQSFSVVSVTAIEPVGAMVCIRDARLVECPIGVYSVCASPVLIERTTVSPVLMPTRTSSGGLPASRSFAE
jgi:hypothetical protein